MSINLPRRATQSSGSLRARLVALLLVVTQLTSLLIVPLHAVTHAQAAHAQATPAPGVPAVASSSSSALSRLSNLFGHEQGLGCDEWSAAFALDSHSGCGVAVVPAILPSAAGIFRVLPAAPPAVSFGHFLARAPPRR